MKKKTLKRIMALLLAICLITASWPLDTYAFNTEDQVQADQESDTEAGEDPVTLPLSEETSLKQENTETSTTFLVGEEEKKTVFYQEPVRYEDEETGDLIDYDPSLIPLTEEDRDVLDESGLAEMTEDVPNVEFEKAGEADPDAEEMTEEAADGPVSPYAYTNAQGDAKQYFPEVLDGDTPVILAKEDYSVTMAPEGDFAPVEVEEEAYTDGYEKTEALPLKAVYESPSDHCSYAFTSMKDGVKEELVLERLPSTNVFTYEITLGGLGIRKAEGEEGFLLYDQEDREAVAAIAAPFMNDATGKAYSEGIRTELEKVPGEAGTYRMTLILDAGYLRDARRRYPVTVDPTVTWKGNTDMGDVCVCGGSGYKDKNFYDSTTTGVNMKAGKGDKGVYRTYIDFRNLKTTVRNKYVESAIFSMYETGYSNSGQVVQAYRVKSSWSRSQITWNNKPAYETLYDTVSSTGKNKKLRKLDLTAFVRGLAKNVIENYGIMLKGSTETGHYCEFHGSRYSTNTSLRSKFVVTYYDKPTAPTSVTITPNYLKKGCKSTVKWTGISSKGLAYVQYRVARYNTATGQDQDTVIAYGPDRKLGTTASGSYLLPNTAAWKEGVWHLYVRGVDKGDIPGSERGALLYIDGTAPAQGTVTISPSTSQGNPSTSTQPVVNWSGFTDTYLKDIAYQVNGGPYRVIGHTASGSFTPEEGDLPVSGSYVITIRATDRAGYATTASATYYFQATPDLTDHLPNDGIRTSCRYGKNTLTWQADEEASEYIYYRVYSGDNANFVKSAENLAGDHITTSYWTDIRLHDSPVTYKMEVVCTNTEGNITDTLDAGTVTASAAGPDPDTFPSLGSGHSYRSYREMPYPMGTGQTDRVSGNWNYSQQDTTLPSSQISFTVERAYDSQSQTSGMFGPGWNDSLHKELAQGEDGTIYFTDSDGTVYPFAMDGSGYQCPEEPDLTLQTPETAGGGILENLRGAISGLLGLRDGDGGDEEDLLSSEDFETGEYAVESGGEEPDTYDLPHAYTIKSKGGELYRFNDGGQLVSILEPNGTFLLFLYDGEGKVCEVTTETGKMISVDYNAAGLAEEILLPDDTVLKYTYTDGRLTAASH